jgi:mxaJ protein
VFLTRTRDGPDVTSLDDPVLARVRVGVHLIGDDGANSPGAHALGKRHIVKNVVGFPIYGDYTKPNPPARLVTAVEDGTIDVAIIWGPYAGYFAKSSPVPLHISAVSPLFDPPAEAFAFSISMGVRRNDFARRRVFNEFIVAHRKEIDAILDRYGVPRLK